MHPNWGSPENLWEFQTPGKPYVSLYLSMGKVYNLTTRDKNT
jgi:hypothetical protein